MITNKDVGRRLRYIMAALDIETQKEFGQRLGVAEQTVGGYLNGTAQLSLATALLLHDVYGIDLHWIYRGKMDSICANGELRDKILKEIAKDGF